MNQKNLAGKVQTVLGLVEPYSLGVTLPHEHLLFDHTAVYFVEPNEATERKKAYQPVRVENLYWIKLHCMSNLDNMKLDDEQLAIKEAMLFKQIGGKLLATLLVGSLYCWVFYG